MNRIFTVLSLLLGANSLVSAQTYADRQEITQVVTSGVQSEQKAVTTLVASNEIRRGGSAHYIAGQSITLQPGFTAQAGSVFHASIETVVSTKAAVEGSDQMTVTVFPNPFVDVVSISYSLPAASTVKQTLTDEQGRLIQESGGRNIEAPGTHQVQIKGETMPTGIYFLQLQTTTDRKVIRLLKK